MKWVSGLLLMICCVLVSQVMAQDENPEPVRKPGHVLVKFLTVPSFARATVYHGRKKLGETPLLLQFPKNSGPRDVVLKRGGYLWVNTRANTFRDEKIVVKMTKTEEASTLFGYRKPIDPDGGVDGGLDGGVASDGGVVSPDAGVVSPDAGVQPVTPAAPASP